MPLVSIVIPCCNAGPWIRQTIESALAQTWKENEIIVVDDGSTDDSLTIAQSFESLGVRVVAQPNAGAAAARNTGLHHSRGDYIQFLDADDLLAPDKIEIQMQRLLQSGQKESIAAGAWARFFDDPRKADFHPRSNWRDLTGIEFLQLNFEKLLMMHPAAWLAPRSLLDFAGPWDETLTLNDDGEYFARVVLKSSGILFCAEARSYYRTQVSGSLSRRTDSKAMHSLFRSMDSITRQMRAHDDSPRTRDAIAYAWKWTAWELYPWAPQLCSYAEDRSAALGGSKRPFPASGRFKLLAPFLGWRLAKRLTM